MALKLDAKIPAGALEEKWSNHKAAIKVVSPANKRKLDIIIVGTGLGGASAAASLGELGYNVKVFCIQDSPRRAHSIAAQGGINAAKNASTEVEGMGFAIPISKAQEILNNLMTKKARTILTAFAGSIGIIGIALILSLSNGIQTYINDVQEDTLSSYPVTIEAESADMSGMVTALMGVHSEEAGKTHTDGRVYASNVMYDLMQSLNENGTQTNDLEAFKRYLDNPDSEIHQYLTSIQYACLLYTSPSPRD